MKHDEIIILLAMSTTLVALNLVLWALAYGPGIMIFGSFYIVVLWAFAWRTTRRRSRVRT